MTYSVPGRADAASDEIRDRWNEVVAKTYTDLFASRGSRFITSDPSTLSAPSPVTAKWACDPAEPAFCTGSRAWTQRLADWPVRGRTEVQNEYCEYVVVYGVDAAGKSRPKRVEITTELAEYWVAVAGVDPDALAAMAEEVLGARPTWDELYGRNDPHVLSRAQRERAFATRCAGHGNIDALLGAGVPEVPTGPLNTSRALFMRNAINGLDDLVYIVMFGAQPYAVTEAGRRRPAMKAEVFDRFNVLHLACRHADPAAAQAAMDGAWLGAQVAFADPLGMYIQSFADDLLGVDGAPLPDEWVQWSRGHDGMYQRLVVGPPDDQADAWLDDITVSIGDSDTPLVGGYQLMEHIEVGPNVLAGAPSDVADDEYVELPAVPQAIDCAQAGVCTKIRQLQQAWTAEQPADDPPPTATALRRRVRNG